MQDQPLQLAQVFRIALRYWWILLSIPVSVGLAVYTYENSKPQVYIAATVLLVQQQNTSEFQINPDINLSRLVAVSYLDLYNVGAVLERASELTEGRFAPPQLRSAVTATVDNQLFTITARATDPNDAAQIANSVGQAFITNIEVNALGRLARLQTIAAAQGITDADVLVGIQLAAASNIETLRLAVPNADPIAPNPNRRSILAGGAGLLIAIALIFSIERIRDPLGDIDSIESLFNLHSLGSVRKLRKDQFSENQANPWGLSTRSWVETFRQILVNLRFTGEMNNTKTVLITSPRISEGKTTIAAHLAVAGAQTGLRIVLMDIDLRRPSIAGFFTNQKSARGVTDFVAGEVTEKNEIMVLQDKSPKVGSLTIVHAGTIPPNPSQIILHPRMQQLISSLAEESDLVIIDSPPVLGMADAVMLAQYTDAVIMVVDKETTKRKDLRSALEVMRRANTTVAGIVTNKDKSHTDYYVYDGYYSLGDGSDRSKMRLLDRIKESKWLPFIRSQNRRLPIDKLAEIQPSAEQLPKIRD